MADQEQIKEILYNHGYEYKDFLGRGNFSSVYLCHSLKYNHDFAIKITVINEYTREEYNTLISLNHPNIIRLYDAFVENDSFYLVMEYCPFGTIRKAGKLSYEQFVYYARQILDALSYCHSKHIAHRDIKPENIFFDQFENCKLADFGISKQFEALSDKSEHKCGSTKFLSPEIFQQHEFCPFKTDIWALGITFFCMSTGHYPFKGDNKKEIKNSILYHEIDFSKYDIDPRIRFLILKMTSTNPKLRPSADKLLKMQMFTSISSGRKLSSAFRLATRKSFSHEPSRMLHISTHKSMTFTKNTGSASSTNEEEAPMTKMHTFKSSSINPSVQRINCRFQPYKII